MDTELHNSVDCICGAMTAELYNSERQTLFCIHMQTLDLPLCQLALAWLNCLQLRLFVWFDVTSFYLVRRYDHNNFFIENDHSRRRTKTLGRWRSIAYLNIWEQNKRRFYLPGIQIKNLRNFRTLRNVQTELNIRVWLVTMIKVKQIRVEICTLVSTHLKRG